MAVQISIPYNKRFSVGAPPSKIQEAFRDPKTVIEKNFPGVATLTAKGGGIYEWTFFELKQAGHSIKIQFQTELREVGNQIEIHPVGEANASLKGTIGWQEAPNGSEVTLDWNIILNLPIPSLLKGMAEGFAKKELVKLFDKFADNVKNSLQ